MIETQKENIFELSEVSFKNILSIGRLEIPKGITCVLGESGVGKSTFLRLLNNLISPDMGEILYKNTPLESIDPIILRRKVVMLMQNPVIFPGTVRDNLLFGLKVTSNKAETNNDELLDILRFLELQKISLDTNAALLSGGEKQRICLGRLMIMDPEVYLLDEPSAALDEGNQELIIQRITQHAKNTKKDLIMILHSVHVAKQYSDCLIHFQTGSSFMKEVMPNGRSSS